MITKIIKQVLVFSVVVNLVNSSLSVNFYSRDNLKYATDPAILRFRKYLSIDTSRDENLGNAVKFWQARAEEIGLPIAVHVPDGKPIVVITWEGQDPTLPSIMLNSHMDVVPAGDERLWKYHPYSGHLDEKGDIYGRGAQDTKDVGMQYYEAVKRLREDNVQLLRTIHLTLMPDEETGGHRGMKSFVKTEQFENLNVGFALDEGGTSKNDTLFAIYEDRRPWQMEFTIFGDGGHGSSMPLNTAIVKAARFISKVNEFRDSNIRVQRSLDIDDFGRYTSININYIKGGTVVNVIPPNITIGVDMRLSSDATVQEMDELIKSWMAEAGKDTKVRFLRKEALSKKTVLNTKNLYWVTMKETLNNMGYEIIPAVCPASTDMMKLRNLGYPAVGFSTKVYTKSQIHNVNEYLNAAVYLNGIQIYYQLIKNLGNVPDFDDLIQY